MATVPQGNQELLMVKGEVGRPPCEFGVYNNNNNVATLSRRTVSTFTNYA